jgi:hypothetical protein
MHPNQNPKINHATVLATLVPEKNTYGAHYVGRTLYASINPETLLKAFLFRGDNTGYAGLSLTILNKRFGQIDTVVIPFPVYTTANSYSVRKMLNMCSNPSDLVQWDENLTEEELAEIHRQVNDYIDAFDALPDMSDAML